MELNRWSHNLPNPDPFSAGSYVPNYPQSLNSDAYSSQHYHPTDPHGALVLPQPQPQPPGVNQPYVPPPGVATVTYSQPVIAFEPQQIPDASMVAASYYPDPNSSFTAAPSQLFTALYGAGGVAVPNSTIQPHKSYSKKKGSKKVKIVQSAWCEVCKIDCNSRDVLEIHKLGKKHKKNIEKLSATTMIAPAPVTTPLAIATAAPAVLAASTPLSGSTSAGTGNPVIGISMNHLNAYNPQKARKKAAAREDLATKKRKIMEGGAAADAVRTCAICNVVCNSDTVFTFHLAGQKHASMVKKRMWGQAVTSAM